MRPFLSVGARYLINLEVLNTIESAQGIIRHRRAPVIDRTGKRVLLVPVISGESIANSYQLLLSKASLKNDLPVCTLCSKGMFIKHSDLSHLRDLSKLGEDLSPVDKWLIEEGRKATPEAIEGEIIKGCVVEDIGGFLINEMKVKRTSRFQTGYMLPVYDGLEAASKSIQQHKGEDEYYVEIASALYSFTFNLDIDGIGCASLTRRRKVIETEERRRRIKLAVQTLAYMMDSFLLGANRSRFLPTVTLDSFIITLSSPYPFVVSSPARADYIEDTLERAKDFEELSGSNVQIWYSKEGKELLKTFKSIVEEAAKADEC